MELHSFYYVIRCKSMYEVNRLYVLDFYYENCLPRVNGLVSLKWAKKFNTEPVAIVEYLNLDKTSGTEYIIEKVREILEVVEEECKD